MQLTSLEAYDSIQDVCSAMEQRIYDTVKSAGDNGLTLEEISNKTGIKLQTVCGRRLKLEQLGFLEDTGNRRQNESGRSAKVWIAR
jgi:predicted transcriptional regulator